MKYWKDNSNETFFRDLQTLALRDELSNWTYLIYQAPLIYDTYNCTMYEPYEPILEANEIDVDKLSCPYAPKCNPTQKKKNSRQDLRTFLQIFDLIKKYLSIQLFMDKKIINLHDIHFY